MSTIKALGISKIKALGLNNTGNTEGLISLNNKKYVLNGYWVSKSVKFGDRAKFRFLLSNDVRLNGWVIVTLIRVRKNYFDEQIYSEELRVTSRNMEIDFIMSESLIDYLNIDDVRENKGLKFYCKVTYLDDSYEFEEKNPLEIKFVPDYCGGATEYLKEDNFPYKSKVFEKISEISDLVKYFAKKHSVPEVAVAGAIADEYNAVIKPGRNVIDWFQDGIVSLYPNIYIQITKDILSESETITKLRNPTMNDLGIGNIKLQNAKTIYDLMPLEFQKRNWDYTDLVDYLNTNVGCVHFASLTIKIGQAIFNQYISNYSDCTKEAVLVTFYKQGPKYFNKFFKRLQNNTRANPLPGEGSRVAMQRNRILKALNTKLK